MLSTRTSKFPIDLRRPWPPHVTTIIIIGVVVLMGRSEELVSVAHAFTVLLLVLTLTLIHPRLSPRGQALIAKQ